MRHFWPTRYVGCAQIERPHRLVQRATPTDTAHTTNLLPPPHRGRHGSRKLHPIRCRQDRRDSTKCLVVDTQVHGPLHALLAPKRREHFLHSAGVTVPADAPERREVHRLFRIEVVECTVPFLPSQAQSKLIFGKARHLIDRKLRHLGNKVDMPCLFLSKHIPFVRPKALVAALLVEPIDCRSTDSNDRPPVATGQLPLADSKTEAPRAVGRHLFLVQVLLYFYRSRDTGGLGDHRINQSSEPPTLEFGMMLLEGRSRDQCLEEHGVARDPPIFVRKTQSNLLVQRGLDTLLHVRLQTVERLLDVRKRWHIANTEAAEHVSEGLKVILTNGRLREEPLNLGKRLS